MSKTYHHNTLTFVMPTGKPRQKLLSELRERDARRQLREVLRGEWETVRG